MVQSSEHMVISSFGQFAGKVDPLITASFAEPVAVY